MPLSGDYEPSTWDWVREHADKIMESGSADGTDMKGRPLILLTTIGAKTGKIRKTPLMRVEHDGEYAVVASLGGAPKNPLSPQRSKPVFPAQPASGTIDRCPLN